MPVPHVFDCCVLKLGSVSPPTVFFFFSIIVSGTANLLSGLFTPRVEKQLVCVCVRACACTYTVSKYTGLVL